jgi:N-acetylglucosamine kinase-like BadF-type ATPase
VTGSLVPIVVGMDAGGSKLGVRGETLDGSRVFDVEIAAPDWEATPFDRSAQWLLGHLERVVPFGFEVVALGVGAQGCDTEHATGALEAELLARGPRASVVNDAALLVPAAGHTSGIGVIAGTGAIAVGSSGAGDFLAAGGWGWVIGDEAGAAAIVREATKAALLADDRGEPDDGLLDALERAFSVDTAEQLARTVNDVPTAEHWGPRAPVVFAAADAGSALALGVIEGAADHLADLVTRVRRKGAIGSHVVAAGSVITGQARLFDGFRDHVAGAHPDLTVELLGDKPVAGGILLARALVPAGASA